MEDNRPRYAVECPACHHKFSACKSIGHKMGVLDAGMGHCPNCTTFLNLTLDEENDCMKALDWELYLKNKGIEAKGEN